MWPGLTRRPSLLQRLLTTLQQLLASQQETNLLLRELLLTHGKSPMTPQSALNINYLDPSMLEKESPLSVFLSGMSVAKKPIDPRLRTAKDVSTTMDLPAMDGQPTLAPEPSDA